MWILKKKIDKFKESMIKISIFGAFNIRRKEYNDAKLKFAYNFFTFFQWSNKKITGD